MSEISEIEIKSMSKEQNYMCGYKDGRTDVLDKIRAEIDAIETHGQIDEHTLFVRGAEEVKKMALNIIDNYRNEVSE